MPRLESASAYTNAMAMAMAIISVEAELTLDALEALVSGPRWNLSEGRAFSEADGQSIYRATCQACHTCEGQGASGAGAYPALASNPRLASASYAVMTVLYGRKGMPGFAEMLSEEQVAAVTNYERTHMGNQRPDAVTPTDVKTLRGTP
jgi:mono/diheme cytochrome c family protein